MEPTISNIGYIMKLKNDLIKKPILIQSMVIVLVNYPKF